MTAVIEEVPTAVWLPDGWDEPSLPCELVFFFGPPKCDNPAEIAFRLSCCGFVKYVCEAHWTYLRQWGMSKDKGHQCAGCKRIWRNFDTAVTSYWRI